MSISILKAAAAARLEDSQARPEQSQGNADDQPQAHADVFHFPQFSTISTVGQSAETYAVDKNFIRDLEKNLGTNESKYSFLLFLMINSTNSHIVIAYFTKFCFYILLIFF